MPPLSFIPSLTLTTGRHTSISVPFQYIFRSLVSVFFIRPTNQHISMTIHSREVFIMKPWKNFFTCNYKYCLTHQLYTKYLLGLVLTQKSECLYNSKCWVQFGICLLKWVHPIIFVSNVFHTSHLIQKLWKTFDAKNKLFQIILKPLAEL